MTETILAGSQIEVGEHTTAKWLGLTVNTDTVLSTAIAAVIDATERRTIKALSKPSSNPTPKNAPTMR